MHIIAAKPSGAQHIPGIPQQKLSLSGHCKQKLQLCFCTPRNIRVCQFMWTSDFGIMPAHACLVPAHPGTCADMSTSRCGASCHRRTRRSLPAPPRFSTAGCTWPTARICHHTMHTSAPAPITMSRGMEVTRNSACRSGLYHIMVPTPQTWSEP